MSEKSVTYIDIKNDPAAATENNENNPNPYRLP